MKYADLHLHTNASDGTCNPKEVVKRFAEAGFSAISITDHDTVSSIDDAISMGEKLEIEVIPGIEFSTIYEQKIEVHILGYYIKWQDNKLKKTIDELIDKRKIRGEKIIKKLNNIGINIDKEDVFRLAGSNFIGRLHIARVMLEKGYIKSISEAFTEKFMGRGGRAYVERLKMEPKEAIELILELDGIPVIAHPAIYEWGPFIDEKIINEFADYGLMGIEVFYPYHSEEIKDYYFRLTRKYNMLVTGGSDFHGEGTGRDDVGVIKLPMYFVDKMKERIQRK
ncbi:MAG TPA: PHP domain-containing protein [Thermoanaerobacterales bacterium]|nr:PHP domain-containing protein [Thermoanaerobacterales bacterium]